MNLIALIQIGGTDMAAPRTIRADIAKLTWQQRLDAWLPPLAAVGIRRVMLWMPQGYEAGVKNLPYRFDMVDQVKLAKAAETRIKAGMEIIVYTGRMVTEPVMCWRTGVEWINAAIYDILQLAIVGCSIAFDNLDDGVTCGDQYELFVRLLEATGVRVYVEPRRDDGRLTMLGSLPGITIASDLEKHPRDYWLSAEHIAMMTGNAPPSFGWAPGPKTGADWNAALWGPKGWVRRQIDAGRTPCVTFNRSMLALGTEGMRKVIESTIS